MYAGAWTPNQHNLVMFVLVDDSGVEVAGLGDTFDLEISKAGAPFVTGTGVKDEVGRGWYSYLSEPDEADTPGPVALKITGTGTAQQNVEYIVMDRSPSAVEFVYTVTNSQTSLPIEGVDVRATTDANGLNVAWRGTTDSFGVARDIYGNLPRLDPGVYFFWSRKAGYQFQNPDTESVP